MKMRIAAGFFIGKYVLNDDPGSDLYHHIDTDNIGIAGHSQSGVGAINAVTNQANGSMYKAIVSESPTSSTVAYALNLATGGGWECDISRLTIDNIPFLLRIVLIRIASARLRCISVLTYTLLKLPTPKRCAEP